MDRDRDYVLGTHDEEINRLGLQHRVWSPRVTEAWRRSGFAAGQTLLDVGCGPGFAALDLARIVGPKGRVVAVDRSRRFLDALETARRELGFAHLETHEIDLDEDPLPAIQADGAWARWVFAFLRRPRDLLARVAMALKPGGVFVAHEYFDYSTWRLAPPCPELEEFVEIVMRSWRASGGEPDIGLLLPRWLGELGFEISNLRPLIEIVPPTSHIWQWPKSFIRVGLRCFIELGQITSDRARAIEDAFAAREAEPQTLLITPAVLEVVAVRTPRAP